MKKNTKRPEWVPKENNEAFATNVLKGVKGSHDGFSSKIRNTIYRSKRKELSVDEYYNGIVSNDRAILARAITLVESNAKKHFEIAQRLIQKVLKESGKSVRIGVSGVPGAGKSTLIESLGLYLCELGHKVAVIAVDPSSSITKGSVLGDKTRMEQLSNHPNAFIRPSPSGGMLGGVARKSRETILLCEAAGYDVILVETVGVGQNEVTVRSMVDFFLLVLITGAGDDLQGMKKGVMEICDAIAVNKADGDNINRAKAARADFENMLHYLMPSTKGWISRAFTVSAIKKTGLKELWEVVIKFVEITKESGFFYERRSSQNIDWVFNMVIERLKEEFYSDENVKKALPEIEKKVLKGALSPTLAATKLLKILSENKKYPSNI